MEYCAHDFVARDQRLQSGQQPWLIQWPFEQDLALRPVGSTAALLQFDPCPLLLRRQPESRNRAVYQAISCSLRRWFARSARVHFHSLRWFTHVT